MRGPFLFLHGYRTVIESARGGIMVMKKARFLLPLFLLFVMFILSASVSAQRYQALNGKPISHNGASLYQMCTSRNPDGTVNWGSQSSCRGYIMGVYDGLQVTGREVCAPSSLPSDLQNAIVNYLAANPQAMNLPARAAIQAAFRCAK